jgi:hypothetical protein
MRGKCSNSISRWRRGHSNGVAAECSRYKVSSTWSQTWQCRRRTIRRHASRSPGIAVEGNGPSMTLATVGGIGRDAAGSSALPDVDQQSHLHAVAAGELDQIQNLRPPPYGGRGHPDRHGRDLPRWIARSCSRQEALLLRFGFGHAYFHGNELGGAAVRVAVATIPNSVHPAESILSIFRACGPCCREPPGHGRTSHESWQCPRSRESRRPRPCRCPRRPDDP